MQSLLGGVLSIVILSLATYAFAQANFIKTADKAYATQSVRLPTGH